MKNIVTSLLLVSIFKNILKDGVISAFVKLISLISSTDDINEILKAYSQFTSNLYEKSESQNFYLYFKKLIYTDENILSRGCSECISENNLILDTAKYELSLFDELVSCNYQELKQELISKFSNLSNVLEHLPFFSVDEAEAFNLDDILLSYRHKGFGIFSCYSAFQYTKEKEIIPIKNFDTLSFSDLKNYEYQKDVIKQNTKAFLEDKEANNILLYGDRGCGKSSTVKALLNEFSSSNLKIIQVYKESFVHLQELFQKLRNQPTKFIIFADDISFDENDKDFSSIKAILEGSLANKPTNSIIYATTNRMHLVKETFTSREGNEVHYNDTIDEMVSLSDRFGIMLTFSLLTKSEYLDIVEQIAIDCCVEVNDILYKEAEAFAALKSIRTPRVARQFIVDFIAKHEL